ncbi:hypothetical protein ACNTMW_29635 [Planosporangium sp. 12N6]|uniref:hypothetical protein n=1 Tax=Planosporangium spinosum TaxID=3402278 RepID=UPI003CE6D8BD
MLSDALDDRAAAGWTRSPANPVVSTAGGDWCRDFIAPCSLVERDGRLWLYTEGSAGGHEQIGLFTAPVDDPTTWTPSEHNPVLRVGDGFDRGGVFDPAVVEFRGRWLMYFSATEGDAHEYAEQLAHGQAGDGPVGEWIGLATSDDGVHFDKHPGGPVLSARCPFALVHDDRVYLFFVQVVDGGYRIHLSVSADGVTFEPVQDAPVLDVGGPGSWDGFSVTTPKVFRDGDRFCMSFAGDDASLDDPKGIGLAYSDDLVHWEKVPGNPVFTAGPDGEFDSVSLQSPLIRRMGDRYVMLYAGSDHTIFDGLHSQVGLAWAALR